MFFLCCFNDLVPFPRKVGDVSRIESRLDSKKSLYMGGSCSITRIYSVVSYESKKVTVVMSSRASPLCFICLLGSIGISEVSRVVL